MEKSNNFQDHLRINLRVQEESGNTVFLFKGKLYIGTFPEDNFNCLFNSTKTFFPDENIECLKFKGEILDENNCTEKVFLRSDASFCGVYPIEICVKD